MNETQKIQELRDRLNQWIVNAERNRLSLATNFIHGSNMNASTYIERARFIDGQIEAYKETLKVL